MQDSKIGRDIFFRHTDTLILNKYSTILPMINSKLVQIKAIGTVYQSKTSLTELWGNDHSQELNTDQIL